MRNPRRLGVAMLAVFAAAATTLSFASPADAAAGVKGRLESAAVVNTQPMCCTDTVTLKAKGWAYNQRTAPVQEVFIRFTAARDTEDSNTFVARKSRPDAKKKFRLHSAKVGFSFSDELIGSWAGARSGTACAYARDHNTAQAWRKIGCHSFKLTWA